VGCTQELLYNDYVQQLNEFLKSTNYQPVFNIGIALVGLAVCALIVVSLLHTLHLLGGGTPLYRKHKPVKGWNRRFFSASGVMIIFLLMLMWLLNVWSHKAAPAH
jgi:phosphoglycerol transferase MdoB-like AlkP superfamily enzyme